MRLLQILSLALLIPGGLAFAQQPSYEETQELGAMIRELATALRQTQDELREARGEIRALRVEIEKSQTAQVKQTAAPTSTATADRLAIIEENQQLMETRVEQIQQVKVETASKYRVKLDGMVLFNSGYNRGEVDSTDVPNIAVPRLPGQNPKSVFGTLRQSLIGLQVIGPRVGGANTSAELHLDLFGGFPNELDSTAMGLVRLRVALARLDWKHWSLRMGQDQPFITPEAPTSLAAVGTPSMGYSGNLWTWAPQIVGERRWSLGEHTQARLEFGVMDPYDGESPPDQFERYPEAAERSGMPALEVRQSWTLGSSDRPIVFGTGGYMSRQDYGYQRIVKAWAATVDWNARLANKWATSGAFFRGRGLGGLWGGIGFSETFNGPQALATSAVRGVNAVGGWAQLKYMATARTEFNGVFGMDNPFAEDVRFSKDPANQPLLRNQTEMVNVIEHLRSNVLAALEYRHLRTTQSDNSVRSAEHVNLAIGVKF